VEVVEAVTDGAVFDGALPVDLLGCGAGHVHAEVPLADGAGGVSVLFEKARHGEAVFGDQRSAEAHEDAFLEVGPPVVAGGEYAVASWGADRRGRVGIGKAHALFRQLIHGGSGDFSLIGIETLDVPVAEVVGENEDDVGRVFFGLDVTDEEGEEGSGERSDGHFERVGS